MALKPVSGLWIGGALSYIEQLCLRSVMQAGHAMHLYTYGDVAGIPSGVDQRSAQDILPINADPATLTYDSVEILADRFKYRLLQRDETIWTDLDMYCTRAWDVGRPYLMCWQKGTRLIGGAVFAAPPDSALLKALVDFTDNPAPIPPWYTDEEQADLRRLVADGRPTPPDALKRGVFGVHAITHFAKDLGLTEHVMDRNAFFPCEFSDREALTNPEDTLTPTLERSYGVHLWGRRLRRSVMSGEMRIPAETSFFGKALAAHGIDVAEAETDNATPDGLIKQNTAVDQLDATELRRAMAELEKKAERKFDRLSPPKNAPQGDPDVLIVTAMKNEGAFVLEWFAYHLSIGVKHFMVYTKDRKSVV